MPPVVAPPTASILDPPPPAITASLETLAAALDAAIPTKRLDENVLVATWNLRAFGALTERWATQPGESPRRNLHDVRAIAEVISRFDVIAVQEVRGNLKALRETLRVLGPDWGFLLTDVTLGTDPNPERLAFLFDTRRVTPSGLACELVVPKQWRDRIRADALSDADQFARTPYAVSFRTGGRTFTLVTLHVVFGDKGADRLGELRTIAQWLADWAGDMDDYGQNLICLGDFNVDRKDDATWQALMSTGLGPPPELDGLARTISARPGKETFYDQIAWFTGDGRAALSLRYAGSAGRFAWTDHLLTDVGTTEKSWRISDHYPLWVELGIGERMRTGRFNR